MRKILLLLLIVCSSVAATDAQQLSDSTTISLLTCEPAEAIYARFWHSAIRVCDPQNNIDNAYNYGIFDFSSPYFIPKFLKGDTDYILAAYSTEAFLGSYMDRKSTVYQQVLNLSSEEKQMLYDALEKNSLPENRTYRYNFVYDNCATRAYYIIKKILDKQGYNMEIDYSLRPKTYRGVFEEFLGRDNWQRFCIDVVIGSNADKRIGVENLIAFPRYTMEFVEATTLRNDSVTKKFVERKGVLCQYPLQKPSEHSFFRPTIVCSLLMVIVVLVSFWGWKRGRYFAWLDFVLFLICGLMGLVVFYLMFFSTHPLVDANYNLLWLNPLMVVFAFLLLNKKWRGWLSYFAILNAFATIAAIIILLMRIQIMHASFLSLMAMMLVRSLMFFQQNFRRKT